VNAGSDIVRVCAH